MAADGKYVTTGFPPDDAKDYQAMLDWLQQLGIEDDFSEAFFLRMGVDRGGVDPRTLGSDVEAAAIYGAGRSALCFIASQLPAYDFFLGTQERDIQCGIIYAPEEVIEDPHFQAREIPRDRQPSRTGTSHRLSGRAVSGIPRGLADPKATTSHR